MNQPTLSGSAVAGPDTHAIVSCLPVPGFGVLPVNAFVIHGREPVLVDTGMAALRTQFMAQLRAVLDPRELRWIWITHTDPDHLGNLEAVLAEAPHARVVTTYLGMGKMGLLQLPLERVFLLNPGQRLNIGDRQLTAIRLPTFDAPETTGLFDSKTRTLFSADCFGALLDGPAETAAEISPDTLRDGCVAWATVDAPWLELVDPASFKRELEAIFKLDPATILSAHLPPATGMTATLLEYLSLAREAPRFVGPDQLALEQLMAARPAVA